MTRAHVIAKPLVLLLVISFMSVWIFRERFWTPKKRDGELTLTLGQDPDAIYSMKQELLKLYNNLEHVTSNSKSSGQDTASPAIARREHSLIFRKRITLPEIDRRFCPKARHLCDDDCQCDDNLSDAKTVQDWEDALKRGTIKGKPLFKSYEYVFPWEDNYLSKPPLKDINQLPDLELSRVWFLSQGELPVIQRKVICKKYESISFRVDLVNRYGLHRSSGGDEVRAWIDEDPSTRSGKRFSTSGSVRDLGNGSYIVTVTPWWVGETHLKIGVIYPREYIRAALHHARIGSNRFIFGMFKNDDVEEVTVCHATPNVPGRSCICNYTSWNTVPFYCGRPLDKRLSCHHWNSVWPASQPPFKHVTSAEALLATSMSRTANETVIKHNIVIDVTDNGEEAPVLQPCSKTDRRLTWDKHSPRGYWTKGPQWTSLICHEPEMTSEWVKKCLRSTHVWLIGDSNIVRVRMVLCTLLSCTYVPHYTKWPDSLLGRDEENNISVIFRPHEHPLYLRLQWMSLYLNGGIESYLRSVPSTGKHIVIIHYFLHLASSHLSALQYRLVRLRESLLELFKRNSEVIVGLRGPHISTVQWEDNHMFGGDVLATFMIRMLHDVLEDLKSRVVFLDGWDMSIGIKNPQLHPTNSIPTAMLRTILAFKCS